MLTTEPPCSFIHRFQQAWVHTSGVVRLVANVFSHRGTSMSMTGPAYGLVAALLTSTSMAPNASSVASSTRSMSSTLPTWPAAYARSPPVSVRSSSTVAAHESSLRLVIITLAPAAAIAEAMPRPIPREPPVTMATLPSSLMSMGSDPRGAPPSRPKRAQPTRRS